MVDESVDENAIIKTCTIHGELTAAQCKMGTYNDKPYVKCHACELERSRVYHKKKYEDPEWVEKKHAADKKHWEENKDAIIKRRQRPEARVKRKENYTKYNERHRNDCNKKQQQYRDTLHDHYMKKIIQNGDKSIKFDDIPDAMVELKRATMMIKRGIKQKRTINKTEKYINEQSN